MSHSEYETSPLLLCAIDHDMASLSDLRIAALEQGMLFCSGNTAMELRDKIQLDLVAALVLDAETAGTEGIDFQRDLLRQGVPTSVILTTNHPLTDEVIESLGLGAVAILPRPWPPASMSHHLKLAESQFQQHLKLKRKHAAFKAIMSTLTERQCAVMELAATGMPNKLIARHIEVSQRTVEAERSRLLEALNAKSCADAMIALGEFRILEELERIRRQTMVQRLGNGIHYQASILEREEMERVGASSLVALEDPVSAGKKTG